MTKESADNNLELLSFLDRHNFTRDEYESTGCEWSALQDIYLHHADSIAELQSIGEYVSQRFRLVGDVHSLKTRVKNPEHLIAKIIRKRIESSDFSVDVGNYRDRITDLIGLRALHLFKDQWRPIHEFVTRTWELYEKPIAYYRAGDPPELLEAFRAANCDVTEHKFGYRSIHYVIKSQPDKQVYFAELQVRTIFEEGWSEIDHRIRYPRLSSDRYLADFLTIFNRLAGSADEMGTFIKALSRYLSEQREQLSVRDKQIAEKEAALKDAVSQLKISDTEKKKLKTQIESLRKSSQVDNSFLSLSSLTKSSLITGSRVSEDLLPGMVSISTLRPERTCEKCGKKYVDDTWLTTSNGKRCPTCRFSGMTITVP